MAATEATIHGGRLDRLDDVERVRYPVGHFDMYTSEAFEEVVEREGAFLERHPVE